MAAENVRRSIPERELLPRSEMLYGRESRGVGKKVVIEALMDGMVAIERTVEGTKRSKTPAAMPSRSKSPMLQGQHWSAVKSSAKLVLTPTAARAKDELKSISPLAPQLRDRRSLAGARGNNRFATVNKDEVGRNSVETAVLKATSLNQLLKAARPSTAAVAAMTGLVNLLAGSLSSIPARALDAGRPLGVDALRTMLRDTEAVVREANNVKEIIRRGMLTTKHVRAIESSVRRLSLEVRGEPGTAEVTSLLQLALRLQSERRRSTEREPAKPSPKKTIRRPAAMKTTDEDLHEMPFEAEKQTTPKTDLGSDLAAGNESEKNTINLSESLDASKASNLCSSEFADIARDMFPELATKQEERPVSRVKAEVVERKLEQAKSESAFKKKRNGRTVTTTEQKIEDEFQRYAAAKLQEVNREAHEKWIRARVEESLARESSSNGFQKAKRAGPSTARKTSEDKDSSFNQLWKEKARLRALEPTALSARGETLRNKK
eukprot:TRINITY_DN6068_c0_g1_i1.p1 TRINITY_DN6068_c0_g1~~TRINITY_DN6068_c0_g1_i1.p1  ORF type:complete len:492 (-),score=151.08 TRINITY_DN6068_c0_g1_i1:41-1516(-)